MEYSARNNNAMKAVQSETSKLLKVLIHRPDEGIERVTPARAIDMLYEDIVYLPAMLEEHDIFTKALSLFAGEGNVYDIQQLLTEVLFEDIVKQRLINEVKVLESLDEAKANYLFMLSPKELTRMLISGSDGEASFLNPLPNLIFTRDIGVVINDHILACVAAKSARKRESLLTATVFKHHPMFKDFGEGKCITYKEIEAHASKGELLSIEGGDVMMFGKDHLILATSERTTEAALKSLMTILFEKEVVKKISMVHLPQDRYCMHMDTVFTRVSETECVGFAPLIMQEGKMPAVMYTKDGEPQKFSSLKSLLVNEYPSMKFIPCGEGIAPFDEREQWTDGCNLFAVKDGVAFTYDRNSKTNEALKEQGYSILKASKLIEEVRVGNLNPMELQKTIITLSSAELSRARGGPHCMTMPLLRGI